MKLTAELILTNIEAALTELIEKMPAVEPLKSAVNYAIFPGGKRIRPLLSVALLQDLGGDLSPFYQAASALELLHNSSLVHDDLPAMDNDMYRRGRETVHVKFGEATAILAGDFLVAFAFQVLTKSSFHAEVRNNFMEELCTTYMHLCSGQQLDMLSPEKRGSLLDVHRLKTGALFRASTLFPAFAAGVYGPNLDFFRDLGMQIGLTFQLMDDFIDGQSERKGRPESSDKRNAKIIPTSLEELENAKDKLELCFEKLERSALALPLQLTREVVCGVLKV